MMYSTRFVHVLLVALSMMMAAQATRYNVPVAARQDNSVTPVTTSTTDSTPSTTTQEATTSTSSEDTTTDTTPATTTTPPATTTTPADTDTTTTPIVPISTTSSSTDGGGAASTSTDSSSSTTSSPTTTAKPSTFTSTAYVTTTDSSGHTTVSSSAAVVTTTPSLSGSSGSSDNSGISTGTKHTIIGVTVGVGGAIILAVAGVLFWRLRSKRRSQEENEELVSYGHGFGGPGTAEKTEPAGPVGAGPGRSPFQSTLESYHAPTQTNAASNF
ncbi:hypothetical protein GGR56DRAFT_641851 [Xylariaceae sp. FL0804]|nr:hypothetical protein GGR56DRAFT_641851 [Xylariaceae sp. FL0804]